MIANRWGVKSAVASCHGKWAGLQCKVKPVSWDAVSYPLAETWAIEWLSFWLCTGGCWFLSSSAPPKCCAPYGCLSVWGYTLNTYREDADTSWSTAKHWELRVLRFGGLTPHVSSRLLLRAPVHPKCWIWQEMHLAPCQGLMSLQLWLFHCSHTLCERSPNPGGTFEQAPLVCFLLCGQATFIYTGRLW